ncbi:MAG: cation-translocating P-type ATPase [Caulobacteraceae bacterium]
MNATANLSGLDEAEAARRLAQFGPNELRKAKSRSLAIILRGTLREPMFLLLLGASVLYLVLGDLGEGLFLTFGACLTIGLVVFQEARSERALAALRQLAEPFARVVRGGIERRIPARDLAPGDLLLVGEGERLPADAVLLRGEVLSVDESTLTGESAPVAKQPDPGAVAGEGDPAPGGEGGAHLFAGTLIVRGQGVAEVTCTGSRTALGRIGASLADIEDEPTPLQRTAGRLVSIFGLFALAFCTLVVIVYGLVRGNWVEAALAGVTVSIALIPEEFPMVLAVFMALGSWRLARRKVLVRRAAVIEALGGASVLCVDKTGTLTENRMQVSRLWFDGEGHGLDPDGPAPPGAAGLIKVAALASAVRSVDPMDRAILGLGSSMGIAAIAADEPIRGWPLRPERLAVIQVWREGEGQVAAAKGAPEAIFKLCRLPAERIAGLHGVMDQWAAEGLRVLGAAACRQPSFPEDPEAAIFKFEGLIGFLDPIRADVPAALKETHGAGISVAMITGDYPATALEIARQAGIDTQRGVATGPEIAAMSFDALCARVRDVRVFARIRPEQKLLLVQAFKANGEIVAMTGDGVNDAPALEAAHIGIAMGGRGTDVAREAADLVLLDDSFASIVGGVKLGRRIFANLRKALTYVTAIHVPVAGLALIPIVLGLPPLLYPMHVVLLELVIDPVCSLVFEAEPSEAKAMKHPPRDPREALFGPRQIGLAVLQGAVVLGAVLALYAWAVQTTSEPQARGAAFAALVLGNLTLALSDSAAVGVRLFDGRRIAFWSITLGAVAVLATVLYLPAIASIFRVSPPTPQLAAASILTALGAGGWIGLARALRRPAQAAETG